VAAKQYVEAYYSRPIDYAYFDGCSTGGRKSLMEGTRYPVDYDGLIVGDAAMAANYGGTSTFKQAKAFIPAAQRNRAVPLYGCSRGAAGAYAESQPEQGGCEHHQAGGRRHCWRVRRHQRSAVA
jgi:hypothetical protein